MKDTVAPPSILVACSQLHENSSFPASLRFYTVDLAQDALQFLLLGTRSSAALKAENLFLRKQLALYLEREAKSRRATDACLWRIVISPSHRECIVTSPSLC
jgi:hypothetical protein